MGMHYTIKSNAKERIKKFLFFPAGLSYFFEQIGGYDEKSMVSQIEKILDIDLSSFQKHDFVDNDSDIDCWQNIEMIEVTINELLQKIQSKPNYFEDIKFYHGDYHKIFNLQYSMSLSAWNELIKKEPNYGYPSVTDKKYLKNTFQSELIELLRILDIYKKHGADKIKLFYG